MTQQLEPTASMYEEALVSKQKELDQQRARNTALWAEVERLQRENAQLKQLRAG